MPAEAGDHLVEDEERSVLVGELADLTLAADGTIASVVVTTPDGREELDNGADVVLAPAGTRIRAAS